MTSRMQLVAVAALAAACSRPARGPAGFYGDTHDTAGATDAAPARSIPALPPDEARAEFRAAADAGDVFRAVVYANRAGGALDDGERARATALVDELDADELVAVWAELDPEHPPAAAVALRRAYLARHAGDDDGALAWAARVGDDGPLAARAGELRAEIEARRAVDAAVIAVLLPLSGPYEPIGREVEAAVRLAADADTGARLVFVDTAGTEDGAIAAVDRAVYELHAIAALGPVGQRESAAAAERAVELGLPIALLAPGDGGGAPDAGVFRLWPSGEEQARAAAREAATRGFDRLAVLAPRDEHGRARAAAFADEAARRGAQVAAVGFYDPTATDLEPDLKAFLGLDPATNARLRRHLATHKKAGWKTFSPDIAFDALYVPDDYDRAALVVAYLPFFNVELRTSDRIDPVELRAKHGGRVPSLVQLVGSAGWHHPGLFARGGEAVEGALVIDTCSSVDDDVFATPGGEAFAAAFRRAHGRPPTAVAAQAYDAARLVLQARAGACTRRGAGCGGNGGAEREARAPDGPPHSIDRARATTRPELRRALRAAELDDGACGRAAVGPGGEIDRDAVVLRVDGGQFVLEQSW